MYTVEGGLLVIVAPIFVANAYCWLFQAAGYGF